MRDPKIYHDHLGYGRNNGWYDTNIHLYHKHQLFIHDFNIKSGYYIETYIYFW